MPDRDDETWVDFKRILRRLKALPEKNMQREVLIERLHEMQPPEVLAFLGGVMSGIGKRDPDCLKVLDAINEAITTGQREGPLYELFAEVYRLARKDGNDAVVHLLMISKPQRGPVEEREVAFDHELSKLTLGERKYLARGHNRDRLDRLLTDPDPHLTEQEIVRLASRRPTRDIIQREIYASRWGDRYRVRLSLVCNPYTPTDMSLKLLGFLFLKDLRMVGRDHSLHELVRSGARRLVEEKKGREKKSHGDEKVEPESG